MARPAGELRSPHHLLQSLRSVAAGWRLGPDHGCVGCRSRCSGADDRTVLPWPKTITKLWVAREEAEASPARFTPWWTPMACRSISRSRPVKRTTIGCVRCSLGALFPQTMLLADRGYDADWIRELARQQGAWANIPPKRNRKDPICFSPCPYRARNLRRAVLQQDQAMSA